MADINFGELLEQLSHSSTFPPSKLARLRALLPSAYPFNLHYSEEIQRVAGDDFDAVVQEYSRLWCMRHDASSKKRTRSEAESPAAEDDNEPPPPPPPPLLLLPSLPPPPPLPPGAPPPRPPTEFEWNHIKAARLCGAHEHIDDMESAMALWDWPLAVHHARIALQAAEEAAPALREAAAVAAAAAAAYRDAAAAKRASSSSSSSASSNASSPSPKELEQEAAAAPSSPEPPPSSLERTEGGTTNDDDGATAYCEVCGDGTWTEGNWMLLCDGEGCERAYHTLCLTPQLHAIPDGDWLCPTCDPPSRSGLEDCGVCEMCLDKRKFGGPGIKKKACLAKQPTAAPAAAVAAPAGGSENNSGQASSSSAAHELPIPLAIVGDNGKEGARRRWLVRWEGGGAGGSSSSGDGDGGGGGEEPATTRTTWESDRMLPTVMLLEYEAALKVTFNKKLWPSLSEEGSTGVVACRVDCAHARMCAEYLQEFWRDGALPLGNGSGKTSCTGFTTYGKTLDSHDGKQQSLDTLLITNSLLPTAFKHLPGFEMMAKSLGEWLHERFGTVVELFFAHGLRQAPHTLKTTGFDIHQDTEEFDFIEYTVVVKLTADELDEPPSAMRVVGAERHFKYGHAAGDAGCFLARLYHASVAPESDREHLKIAFFFKASGAGERRARLCTKRSDGQLEVGEARRIVFEDLSSSTVRGAR